LEGKVLDALQTLLMRPELVELFCREYTKHINKLIAAQHAEVKQHKAAIAKLAKGKQNIIDAIKRGIDSDLVKDELEAIKTKEIDLEAKLEVSGKEPKPFLHPAMASRYQVEVNSLIRALGDSHSGEAAEHIRALIEKIVLTPKPSGDELQIDLHGDLAGILTIASEDKTMTYKAKQLVDKTANGSTIYEPSIEMVAGARFELTTFGYEPDELPGCSIPRPNELLKK